MCISTLFLAIGLAGGERYATGWFESVVSVAVARVLGVADKVADRRTAGLVSVTLHGASRVTEPPVTG